MIKFLAGRLARIKGLLVLTLIELLSRFGVYLLLIAGGQSFAFVKINLYFPAYFSFAGDGVCCISAVFGNCTNH